MINSIPRQYFLSSALRRKVKVHKCIGTDLLSTFKNESSCYTCNPVLEVIENEIDGLIPDYFSQDIFFKNGNVMSFYAILLPLPGENHRPLNIVMNSYHESNGSLMRENSYVIDNSNRYDKVTFSHDLKYCVAAKVERFNNAYSSTKSKLYLSIVTFSKSSVKNGIHHGIVHKNICVVNHNLSLCPVKYCSLSPKLNYLVVGTREENDYKDHFDLFYVNFDAKTIKHNRCIFTGSGLRRSTTALETCFNNSETSFVVKQYRHAERAFLYFIQSNHLRSLQIGIESEFCVYVEDCKYGQLFFTLDYETGLVHMMKYGTLNLVKWRWFLLEELGIAGTVSDFTVHSFTNTKMFVSCSNFIYVIDPFNRKLLWKLCAGSQNQVLCLHVNWSGKELFIVVQNAEGNKTLKIFYLPDEISLRMLSAIAVMEIFSVDGLKSLNLPKLVQYQLGILEHNE